MKATESRVVQRKLVQSVVTVISLAIKNKLAIRNSLTQKLAKTKCCSLIALNVMRNSTKLLSSMARNYPRMWTLVAVEIQLRLVQQEKLIYITSDLMLPRCYKGMEVLLSKLKAVETFAD